MLHVYKGTAVVRSIAFRIQCIEWEVGCRDSKTQSGTETYEVSADQARGGQ